MSTYVESLYEIVLSNGEVLRLDYCWSSEILKATDDFKFIENPYSFLYNDQRKIADLIPFVRDDFNQNEDKISWVKEEIANLVGNELKIVKIRLYLTKTYRKLDDVFFGVQKTFVGVPVFVDEIIIYE